MEMSICQDKMSSHTFPDKNTDISHSVSSYQPSLPLHRLDIYDHTLSDSIFMDILLNGYPPPSTSTGLIWMGTAVETVKRLKFLGVHIADKLKWTTHTDSVVKWAQQSLFNLRRLKKCGLSPKTLTLLQMHN